MWPHNLGEQFLLLSGQFRQEFFCKGMLVSPPPKMCGSWQIELTNDIVAILISYHEGQWAAVFVTRF